MSRDDRVAGQAVRAGRYHRMMPGARTVDVVDPVSRLDELIGAWRAAPDAEDRARLEAELVRARVAAFAGLDTGEGADPTGEDAISSRPSPALDPGDLSTDAVRRQIMTHGCAIVRGLVPHSTVEQLVEGIDLAMAGREVHASGDPSSEPNPWYHQLDHDDPVVNLAQMRQWTEGSGAVLAADSPRMLQQLCDMLHATGLYDVIRRYLGARPATSVKKCVLRRVPTSAGSEWHQDGSFLGEDIVALNVWTCLSDCGVEAPGLDIVPRRVGLLPTGTDGALFSWSIDPALVDEVAGEAGVERPVFAPGDVVLFDGMFLHRTAVSEAMTRDRYAIESWFFSPATYPSHHLAMVV